MKKSLFISLIFSQIGFFTLFPIWLKLTAYLHPIVIGVVWFILFFFAFFCVCWVRKDKIQLPKRLLQFLIFFYSLGLLILLFFRPNGQNYKNFNLVPFDTIRYFLSGNVDFLIAFYNLSANIGLFIPYGLYYRYSIKNHFPQLLLMAVISISCIEILQFLTNRGSLDIDDLILNVFGICMGYYVQPIFKKVLVVTYT